MKTCVALGQNLLSKHVSKYLHSGLGAFLDNLYYY